MNVLVVDDIAANRKLLCAILEAEGHATTEAADGGEALEILEQGKVGAIISDILMPRMDGYRLCYEIRASERFRDLPFIFYTSSYTSPSDEKLALEMGADKFLTKPSPAPEIIHALDEAAKEVRRPFSPTEPAKELNLMKEYNQQLVAKLEEKNSELTARNEELLQSEQKLLLHITERKEVEEQLRWKTAFFEAQVHSALDGILIVDSDGKKILQNQRMIDIWEIPAEFAGESDGRRELEWVTKRVLNGRSFAEKVAWLYAHPDEISHDEIELVDGKILDRYSAPVLGRDGKYYGRIWSFRDITQRKRAEEQIAEQAAFLDKARDAILVRDLEGKILFWNKGAERIYGWTSEEVTGKHIDGLIYSQPEKFKEINGLTISQGEWNGEIRHVTKDRRELTVEARWTLIRDNEGNPKSVLTINTDITEKKKIEAQFMRAQRMESIGTLAGGIAHDLNNILAPIMMSIDLLKVSVDNPRAKNFLESIEVSAKRGADIVRQVLSFARGLEGERVEIQPKHLLKDLEHIVTNTFPKDIQLRFEIPNDTWTILGDPTQIHQILLNLCVNARDAMPNGGSLNISVGNCILDEQYAAMNIQARAGRYVNISVTDSGTGMPPELIDKIFEPFFTTKELNKGTGLGLSTVMAIVKSHEGIINVYSEPGRGTTFRVYLPVAEISAEGRKEQSEQASLPRGNGETVLVVDDEASILNITSQTLQAFGYQVLTAADGAEAVALYAQHRNEIAVVLTDMMMPVMDGPSTIHALVRIHPEIKIIAASGLNANAGVAKVSGSGVKHFLTKPYTAGTLLKKLRTILDED